MCQAIWGKSLHEMYSGAQIRFAVDRQFFEHRKQQLMGVDVMEVFSPERVGKFCKRYGLDQGKAMNLKSGYDFDKTSERNKCWETIKT